LATQNIIPLTPSSSGGYNKITAQPVLSLKDVWFRYEKNAPDVLKGATLSVKQGEILAIVGGNGAGKSTLLSVAAGLSKPYRGKVMAKDNVRLLTQNPQSLFLRNTVADDLLEITTNEDELARIIALCELQSVLDNHPYDLSGGEQQRAALAKILLTQPKILLLDEPTKGVDAFFKQTYLKILRDLAQGGMTIVLVSHDIEFCATCADSCALLFDGQVVVHKDTRSFITGSSFYTTVANRMARHKIPGAITVEDIITAIKP